MKSTPARQFETLMDSMEVQGYEHYEISNFAKPGCYSRHNSAYWKGKKYLGIGPSAHSFNGESRQWNPANNAQYLKFIEAEEGPLYFEREVLSLVQQYNEYVMTSLRTIWGCDLEKVKSLGTDFENYFLENVKQFVENEQIRVNNGIYTLARKGKLLADQIAMELFWED